MSRLPRSVLAAFVTMGFAASCGGGNADEAGPTTSPGGSATTTAWPHDFEAPLVGGGTIDIGGYEGQDLVLWFWAPW